MADDKGTWVTVNGRHILIQVGETAGEAIKRTFSKDGKGTQDKPVVRKTADLKDEDNQTTTKAVKLADPAEKKAVDDWITSSDECKKFRQLDEDNSNDPSLKALKNAISKQPDYAATPDKPLYRGLSGLTQEQINELQTAKLIKYKSMSSFSKSEFIATDTFATAGSSNAYGAILKITKGSGKDLSGLNELHESEVIIEKEKALVVDSTNWQQIDKHKMLVVTGHLE